MPNENRRISLVLVFVSFCGCHLHVASSLLLIDLSAKTSRRASISTFSTVTDINNRQRVHQFETASLSSSCNKKKGRSKAWMSVNGAEDNGGAKSSAILTLSGIASLVSWTTVSYLGLFYHPTMTLPLRHNICTIGHALVFPLPLLSSVLLALRQPALDPTTACRLLLGMVFTLLWTAASVFWGPTFSVGYRLFSNPVRYTNAIIYTFTACLALWEWRKNVKAHKNHAATSLTQVVRDCVESFFELFSPQKSGSNNKNAPMYSLGSLGLFGLAIMPQLVGFPTATIPAILGKRLSRSFSGFTFLGAVVAYSLSLSEDEQGHTKILRLGLGIGSLLHIGLVLAKVLGVDGGGLLFHGNGLWEYYPSMIKASGAASFLMAVTYSILVLATLS